MADVMVHPTIPGSNGTLTVVERLANLLETGQFSDFTFKVGSGDDATTFKAHKMLLATASQPLHSLVTSCLQHQNGGSEGMTLSVTDIDPESFQHILKYIYTDDVRVSSIGEAINLMKYSEKWSLDPLGCKTVKFMHQFLDEFEAFSEETKNDLCDLLIWSENGNNASINKRSWEVMMRNINEIVPCQKFLNMEEAMVRKLITHDKFNYKDQLKLFEAIRDWGMNQILTRHMNVNQLQSVIAGLLEHINFKDIGDTDFASTIMPSECLGRSELIAFFMSRGQDMPKEFGQNTDNQIQNVSKWASTVGQEKACRYKKCYKVQESEILKDHELRFRVDRDICLLGVGFGFLFSNVDMGVTVHCQGPWETQQWSDIIQSYCRVTWDQISTANLKLMFNEPVIIQANHSYKILARIGRMSAGASEVELWGGCGDPATTVETKEVRFDFLKSAVHPDREVEAKDKDNSPGIITDLIYQLEFDPLSRMDPSVMPSVNPTTVTPTLDIPRALALKPSVKSPLSPVGSSSTSLIPTATRTPRKGSNKENILPAGQKPELPWLNRKTTIVNNREEKPLISPFRKARPNDSPVGEKVTLPWQRKGSVTDNTPSFMLQAKSLLSSPSVKTNTTTDDKKPPWSTHLRPKPTSSSTLTKLSEPSYKRTEDAPAYKNYSSYSGGTNFSRSGIETTKPKETSKYSTALPSTSEKGLITYKYSNPSSRASQPRRDYSSSLLSDSYSKRPFAYSSSYNKPSSSISSPSSYAERSKALPADNNKYSAPAPKSSPYNSTYDNTPYRSTLNRLSSSREPAASRINDSKSTTDTSNYQRSNESVSKYSQPERYSSVSRNTGDLNSTQSKLGQSDSSVNSHGTYSSVKSPSSSSTGQNQSSYSSYKSPSTHSSVKSPSSYASTNGPSSYSSVKSPSSYSSIKSPSSYSSVKSPSSYSSVKAPSTYSSVSSPSTSYNSYRANDTASARSKDFSPAPKKDYSTSYADKTSPYSSKFSSITSKWQPTSSSSSYYRR